MVTKLSGLLAVALVLPPAFAVADKKVDDSVAKAEAQVDKGNIEEAIRLVDKMTRDNVGPEAQVGAARVLERAGKLDEAKTAAAKAVELSTSASVEVRSVSLARLAALELRVGSSKDALAHAQQAVAARSTPEMLAVLARAQARMRDDKAMATAEQALREAPGDAVALDALGAALAAVHRYDEAAAEFAKAEAADPKLYLPYLHRAEVLVAAGKSGEAEAAARKATEIGPNQGEGWAALGAALFLKDPKNVNGALNEAVQGTFLAPHSPYAQYTTGHLFEAAGNIAPAAEAYKHAVEADPSNVKARLGLIQMQLWRGEIEPAAADAAKLAAENPKDGDAQFMYGNILARKNDYISAMEPLERAVKDLPGNADAHALLGMAYQYNRQSEDAVAEFKKALELAPSNLEYQARYGLLLGLVKQYPEGIAILERVVHSPGYKDSAGYANLGWLYRSVEPPRAQDSIAAYQKAMELDPKSGQAALGMGWAQYAAKSWVGAITAFEKAAQLDEKLAGEANLAIGWCQYWKAVDAKSKDMAAAQAATAKAIATLQAGDPRPGKLKVSIENYLKGGKTAGGRASEIEEQEKGPDLPKLVGDLQKGANASVRRNAARALAGAGAPAVEFLKSALTRDESLGVRAACAKALGAIGAAAKSACPYLNKEIDDSNGRVLLPPAGKKVTSEDLAAENELQDSCKEALRKIGCK